VAAVAGRTRHKRGAERLAGSEQRRRGRNRKSNHSTPAALKQGVRGKTKPVLWTRLWRRIFWGEARLNPSARRMSGPGLNSHEQKQTE
jgi:hypothetical protein